MYKTETHLHTSEVSSCSKLTASEMMELYSKAGYTTVFVTDHFKASYFEKRGDSSWEENVEWLFSGYENAKAAGEGLGINVIMGLEIHLASTKNHYLLYGLKKDFIKNKPDILKMDISELYRYAKENGVFVVQAHPYRDGVCYPTPEYVDAIEVINRNPRHENFDEKAIAKALECRKPMTSGSDAHRPEDIATSGVITENQIRNTEDYISAMLSGKMKLIGGNV